jgi:hypothetical protein
MAGKINWRHLTVELFVVFLGVTAGFILNNWRGNLKEHKQERQYLEGFMEDVSNNMESLKESIRSDSLWIGRAEPLINALAEEQFTEDSTFAVLSMLVSFNRFGARTGTWENITNSGNLNLIRDFSLKKQIVDYHVSIETVDFIDDYFFEYFDRTLYDFLMSEYSFTKNEVIHPDLGQSTRFRNVFGVFYSLQNQRFNAYKELMTESDSLFNNLQQILDQ